MGLLCMNFVASFIVVSTFAVSGHASYNVGISTSVFASTIYPWMLKSVSACGNCTNGDCLC
jgi:hypothetical protein